MRLLACDFDGTLFRKGVISDEDMAAVRAWRANGDRFGIVTGRGALTLLRELARFPEFEADFLLCNNGALLLDAGGAVVAKRDLAPAMTRTLLEHEALGHSKSCALFDGKDMYVLEGLGQWLNPAYRPGVMPRAEALGKTFTQISYGFAERDVSRSWGERLAADLAGVAKVQCSLSVADVIAPEVGKASGIAWAADVYGWTFERIVTAGDDGNDLEMLAEYEGYAMEDGGQVAKDAAGRLAGSIVGLVEKLGA